MVCVYDRRKKRTIDKNYYERYRQTQAHKISHRLSIYVNNVSIYDWDYHLLTDFFHCVATHVRYLQLGCFISHCALCNNLNDTPTVVNVIGLRWFCTYTSNLCQFYTYTLNRCYLCMYTQNWMSILYILYRLILHFFIYTQKSISVLYIYTNVHVNFVYLTC